MVIATRSWHGCGVAGIAIAMSWRVYASVVTSRGKAPFVVAGGGLGWVRQDGHDRQDGEGLAMTLRTGHDMT